MEFPRSKIRRDKHKEVETEKNRMKFVLKGLHLCQHEKAEMSTSKDLCCCSFTSWYCTAVIGLKENTCRICDLRLRAYGIRPFKRRLVSLKTSCSMGIPIILDMHGCRELWKVQKYHQKT